MLSAFKFSEISLVNPNERWEWRPVALLPALLSCEHWWGKPWARGWEVTVFSNKDSNLE
jgi:hypothetical protein